MRVYNCACPQCGAPIIIQIPLTTGDEPRYGDTSFIHPTPPCQYFIDAEPVEYLHAINRELSKSAPS